MAGKIPSSEESSSFEQAIGSILIIGVFTSLFLIAGGIFFLYYDSGSMAISQNQAMFLQEKNFFYFLWDLLRGRHGLEFGIWMMTLGIAILILTPYARVIMSFFYFLETGDAKYTSFTLFVLTLLTASLLLH